MGRGPRIWPLAFLLLAAGPGAAPAVIERYRRSVTLTDEEWHRLPEIMLVRPLTLDLWSLAYERLSVQGGVTRSRERRARVRATVAAINAAKVIPNSLLEMEPAVTPLAAATRRLETDRSPRRS